MMDALFTDEKPAYDWNAYDERIRAANAARMARIAEDRRHPKPKPDELWSNNAEWWLETLTRRGDIITADDLINEIGLPDEGSPNQVGARFKKWHKAGLLEPEGYKQSERKGTHGRAVRLWRVTK
jgi:hypothetical protein